MKRVLITLLCVVFCSLIWAQDIIVTTSSERIDAQITEVSETEVKYKKMDNLTGPTFVIATSKVSSIIYKNGEVQTFAATSQPNAQQSINSGLVTSVRRAEDIIFVPGQTIETSEERGKYYYGSIELDEVLYRDFLKLTCADAYKKYQSGNNQMTILGAGGYCLAGIGGGITAFSKDIGGIVAGGVIMVSGLALGTTFVLVGGKQKKQALDIFNNQCSSSLEGEFTMDLNVGMTQNGIGLTLNF